MKNIKTRTMLKSFCMALAISSSLLSCKKDDTNPVSSNLAQPDKDFLTKAGISNSSEIDLGQLAKQKASATAVKNYADHLILEHTKAQTELIALGALKQFSIPNKPDSVHLILKNQLSALSGKKFDSAYVAGQILDHKKSITDFDNATKVSADPDIKAYANKYLPNLYMHLTTADSLSKNLK